MCGRCDLCTRRGRFISIGDRSVLEQLGREGLDSYYRGDIAARHAHYLEAEGSPLGLQDFHDYQAATVEPLSLRTSLGDMYNMTAPTQGVSSLMILGLFDRLNVEASESFDHVHGLIEATKQAFLVRNAGLGDPNDMSESATQWLESRFLDKPALKINRKTALHWPHEPAQGGTIWMGAPDGEGTVVSFIQSVFWEFGSGLLCPETGHAGAVVLHPDGLMECATDPRADGAALSF